MTDFVRIKNELESLGWRQSPGNGDHIKFRQEGNPNYIVVSMHVTTATRAYDNCIAQIRRIEPRFSLGRPSGWEPKEQPEAVSVPDVAEEQPRGALPAVTGFDKAYRKSKSWIKAGTEVVIDGKPGVFVVREVCSDDGRSVYKEDDLIHLQGKDDKSAEEIVYPDVIHQVKTMKCVCCGEYKPMDLFNLHYKNETKRCTCSDCLNGREESVPAPVSEEPELDPKTEEKKELFFNLFGKKTLSELDDLKMTLLDRACKGFDFSGKSERAACRAVDQRLKKQLDMVTARMASLDFSHIPSGFLALELYNRGEGDPFPGEFRMNVDLRDTIEKIGVDNILHTLEAMGEIDKKDMSNEEEEKGKAPAEPVSLDSFDDTALYQELRKRGWEGKMQKVVTMTLE